MIYFVIFWDCCSFQDWNGVAKCSYFLEFRDNQIWKEAFKDVKLNDFNVDLKKLVEKPNFIKQGFLVAEQ